MDSDSISMMIRNGNFMLLTTTNYINININIRPITSTCSAHTRPTFQSSSPRSNCDSGAGRSTVRNPPASGLRGGRRNLRESSLSVKGHSSALRRFFDLLTKNSTNRRVSPKSALEQNGVSLPESVFLQRQSSQWGPSLGSDRLKRPPVALDVWPRSCSAQVVLRPGLRTV
jgi:hypothetical protein